MEYRIRITAALLSVAAMLGGCSPTVQVQAPNEPITINLNVKIEHEIKVKIDREIDAMLTENSDLF
jgi:ABC-type uncharacterized transport system auxiliary subunit